jgi:crotonobetainyl-CoA:carnitine CoA-transferase CaiB-like acyl-CoA transferase
MLVGISRTDDVDQPVLVPGNPALIVDRPAGGDRRIPWLGEHTDEILSRELGLSAAAIETLRSSSVVG